MYRVYFTNHSYFSQREFATAQAAIDFGISTCFDFSVHADGRVVATWAVFGGLRYVM
jgi:hypothetical protein